MTEQIEYKSTYNEGRGLPEPKWGPLMSEISPDYPLQCPTCGSHDMYASAHPDDPEEIFPNSTVRCSNCGHITDWYEALTSYEHHYTKTPRPIVRIPRVLNKRVDRVPPDAVYVGRPTKWGNIFKNMSREEMVRRHRKWIEEQIRLGNVGHGEQFKYNLDELKDKDVVCWCAPLPCHADILLELASKVEAPE